MSFELGDRDAIEQALVGLSPIDARAALYYLSRYLKQAALFEDYAKDIFDDDERAAPTDDVRGRTLQMIEYIEAAEGATAAEFDDDTYIRWTREVQRVESTLEDEPSPEEVARATQFLDAMVLPDKRRG